MTTETRAITEITTKMVHHARLAKAMKLAEMLAAEYPAITLEAITNEDASRVTGWIATADSEGETIVLHEGDDIPNLGDLLEACEDADIDPEEGAAEDSGPSGSVVAEAYRLRYAEVSSNGQTCGDWLAEQLTSWCHSPDGFHTESLAAMLVANEVDQSGKWATLPDSGQKGWVGRWRMNGRQAMEKAIALNGWIADPMGERHEIPEDALTALRTKHAKWIAKQEKLEAALKQD